MDKNDIKMLPFEAFTALMEAHAREKRNLALALTASIVAGFLTTVAVHVGWLYLWSQYDYESSTETRIYSQDGEGVNVIGDNNGIGAGKPAGADSDNNSQAAQED